MPAWLLDAFASLAASVAVSALVVIARRIERFFSWCRRQADLIEVIDSAAGRLAAASHHLADSADRLERAATRLEAAQHR